jgi:hypothetical protein
MSIIKAPAYDIDAQYELEKLVMSVEIPFPERERQVRELVTLKKVKPGLYGRFIIQAGMLHLRMSNEELSFKRALGQTDDIGTILEFAEEGLNGYRLETLDKCIMCNVRLHGWFHQKLVLFKPDVDVYLGRVCGTKCYENAKKQVLDQDGIAYCEERIDFYRDYSVSPNLVTQQKFYISTLRYGGKIYTQTYFWIKSNEIVICPPYEETFPSEKPEKVVPVVRIARPAPIDIIEISDDEEEVKTPIMADRRVMPMPIMVIDLEEDDEVRTQLLEDRNLDDI